MIPVAPSPEPDDFEERVARPGRAFLAECPKPTSTEWKPYWREVLPNLRRNHGNVCAYCAIWKSYDALTVDHFIPKSQAPELAYRWDNYRLSSRTMNSHKGTSRDVLDPFSLADGNFVLHFPSLEVRSGLADGDVKGCQDTIARLKLNKDEKVVEERRAWLWDYACGHQDLKFLQRKAPFLALELIRQNLADPVKLKRMMRW